MVKSKLIRLVFDLMLKDGLLLEDFGLEYCYLEKLEIRVLFLIRFFLMA